MASSWCLSGASLACPPAGAPVGRRKDVARSRTSSVLCLLPPRLRRSRRSMVVCMAPEEEKMTRRSPLDFPIVYAAMESGKYFLVDYSIEWERPKPGRRADIFPQFSPMKTPLPTPSPYDPPPEEDEEEEEEKKEEEEDPDKEEPDNPQKEI